MERWQLAVRRYKQIVPEPVIDRSKFPFRELSVWLSDDVCPVVEDYCRRPAFRERAAWPIRALASDAATSERRQVEAVKEAAKATATALMDLSRKKLVQRQICKIYPPTQAVIEETVTIGRSGISNRQAKIGTVEETVIELRQIEHIARGGWNDPVNVGDYFEPRQEISRSEGGEWGQSVDLIVFLTPELHPIGNFIVRCLLRRVDSISSIVDSYYRKANRAVQATGRGYEAQLQKLQLAYSEFQRNRQALRVALTTGDDNVLRDSCIILTQVYAAFHPAPVLHWLGLADQLISEAAITIRSRFEQFQNAEMMERIAAALNDLRKLYDDESPQQSAIDEAIAAGGLVIIEASRVAHWEGKPIRGDWNVVPWLFFVALARNARLSADVDQRDIYREPKSLNIMSRNWERLKGRLPESLRKLIGPGKQAHTYRLDLDPSRIHLFQPPGSAPQGDQGRSITVTKKL